MNKGKKTRPARSASGVLDLGYQVVVVRDAVAGIPKEYADAVLANTISMIATVVTSDELLGAWAPAP